MNDQTSKLSTGEFSLFYILGLSVGHGTVDVYGSFLAPLFPLFADKFGLSLTLIGTLASILSISDGLSQPLFGYLGDRMRRPWMAMIAPLWVGVITGFVGLAAGYASLALLLAAAGVGRSFFHPQGAAAVTQYAGPRRGLSMSLFVAGGNLGFASGPILVTALVAAGGLEATVYSIPLGVFVTCWLYATIFRDQLYRSDTWQPPRTREMIRDLLGQRKVLFRLWLVVVLRSLTYFSLFTFLPILLSRHGLSTGQTGGVISLFLLGGALGGITGGWLSDRLGEKSVIAWTLAMAFPFLQLGLIVRGAWGVLFLMLGAGCMMANTPVTIALAQRYTPRSMATTSSIMLGLGWGGGGLLVTGIGTMADFVGPLTALRAVALALVFASMLTFRLPDKDLAGASLR
jgi:FSR family fosmidomycin resistance protein-like MFS transporter